MAPEARTGFYPALLHGFEAGASAIHHQTILCNSGNDVAQQAQIVLQLLDQKIGGVAMVPTTDLQTPAFHARQLQEHGIPVVFCHRRITGVAAPLVAIPFYEVGRLAGKTLAERGHRRVAALSSMWVSSNAPLIDGINDGLRDGGGDLPADWWFVGDSIEEHEEELLKALKEIFAGANPPTAIYCTFDSTAEMTYLLLSQLGLRVPEDVSLLSFGGALREGALNRRLSAVVVDEVATGQKAVTLLNEMRRGERPIDDSEEFVMELGLYDGQTLASPMPIVPAGS